MTKSAVDSEKEKGIGGGAEEEREQKRALIADLKRECDVLLNLEMQVLEQLDGVILRSHNTPSPLLVRRVRGMTTLCDPSTVTPSAEERLAILHEYMNVLHNTTQFIGEMDVTGESVSPHIQSVANATSQLNGLLADIVTVEKKLMELEVVEERREEKEREREVKIASN